MSEEPSEDRPVYRAILSEHSPDGMAFVEVDEGWRSSILCSELYDWAAEWLVEQLQGKPYAPGRRP